MKNIDAIMERIFTPGRDPRSPEYMAGCRAAIERAAGGNPYRPGTAQSDAWYAGWDEGMFCRGRNEPLIAEDEQS